MLVLTYSAMKDLRACPRRFELCNIMGIKSKSSLALDYGRAVHSEIENRFSGREKKSIHPKVFIRAGAMGVVDAMVNKFGEEFFSKYSVEQEIQTEISGVTIAGKVDMFNGKDEIADFKVTGLANKSVYLASQQGPIYANILGIKNGYMRYIIMPRPTINPKKETKKNKAETPGEYRSRVEEWAKEKIYEIKLPLTKTRLDGALKYIKMSVNLLHFYMDNGFPCNLDYCDNKWGGCPYSRICQIDTPEILVDGDNFYFDNPNPELDIQPEFKQKGVAYKLITSGALKNYDDRGRAMMLIKAVIQDETGGNIDAESLKLAGIRLASKALRQLPEVRDINLDDVIKTCDSASTDDCSQIDKAIKVVEEYNHIAKEYGLAPSGTAKLSLNKIIKSGLVSEWATVLQEIFKSEFLLGYTSDWKVSMAWLVKGNNWRKVASGKYRD